MQSYNECLMRIAIEYSRTKEIQIQFTNIKIKHLKFEKEAKQLFLSHSKITKISRLLSF